MQIYIDNDNVFVLPPLLLAPVCSLFPLLFSLASSRECRVKLHSLEFFLRLGKILITVMVVLFHMLCFVGMLILQSSGPTCSSRS